MKFGFSSLAISLAAVQAVSAHYVFDALIINGVTSNGWQYVRKNSNGIQPTKQFITPSDDFRCNSGSFASAGNTQVATVAPGSRLGFRLWNGGTIIHPGPITIHMSKAPGDVRQYRGDGDWFKVYQDIICNNANDGLQDTDWCSWHKPSFTFTLPSNTPPGQYLVRVEHIAIHGAESGNTEFYFTCAQINVTGNGNGVPGPLVKIPGLYSSNDPALRFFIYGARSYPYTNVGSHAVWTGSGNNNNPGQTTTSRPPTSGGSGAPLYGQCGGIGWTGPTTCAQGTCRSTNAYYSQCT